MDPQSPNKLIATKYSEMIPVSFSLFLYFSLFLLLLLLLFYVIIYFYKNYFIIIIIFYLFIFFLKVILFFHVLGCSGMFGNVAECSMFLVLSSLRSCPLPISPLCLSREEPKKQRSKKKKKNNA